VHALVIDLIDTRYFPSECLLLRFRPFGQRLDRNTNVIDFHE